MWIDPALDAIGDDGRELLACYRQRGIGTVLLAGVHTNMCVLERSFSIKQLVRWGMPVYLVRDLTDCMYNPARPPYVSHAAGLELAINYIEQFWCPKHHWRRVAAQRRPVAGASAGSVPLRHG